MRHRRTKHAGGAISSQIEIEQQAVTAIYARLDELRRQAGERLARVRLEGPSGSPQNRSERDAFAALHSDRLDQLEAVEDRLCFGRLDLAETDRPRYIGRLGLTDAGQNTILSDWRAPASEAFYRATAARPLGVLRRRQLLTKARDVIGLDDEVFDLERLTERFGADGALQQLTGDGALIASLAQARTGKMTDIVATIQAEQDELIRAPLEGVLVVQGGPGTGKTAAALHRAAYLLYVHRDVLSSAGVLLLGPSRIFLRYIDQVLPSLGETGVVAATIADLLPGIEARAPESAPAARVKGRAVMARVVRRAVLARERRLPAPVTVASGRHQLRLVPRDVDQALKRARSSGRPHNEARHVFVREALAAVVDRFARELGADLDAAERREITEDLRTDRSIRRALNLAWLPMTPEWLVADLYAKPERLAEFAPELSPAERGALLRPVDSPWTASDVPLLDEAAELLGEDPAIANAAAALDERRRNEEVAFARRVLATSSAGALVGAEQLAERFAAPVARRSTAEAAAADRTWAYGHIVIDEAQELTEMDWRMVLRRCPRRSLTLVGDVAQSSWEPGSWAERLTGPLGRDGWRERVLSVNYRTPAEIMAVATSYAQAARLPASPITSVRSVPNSLQVETVDDVASALATRAAEWLKTHEQGTVGVIVPDRLAGAASDALAASGIEARASGFDRGDLLAARLAVLRPAEAKGLEFDLVLLADPAGIEREAGSSGLYVALTRATARTVLLHAEPLPPALTTALTTALTAAPNAPA